MYRRITIMAALVLLAVMGYAQSTNFGISMGANFTNLVGREKIDNSKPRIGICPGLLLDIPLAYDSYLELGLTYSQQGVLVKTEEEGQYGRIVKSKLTRYVDYATLPIQWKQTFGDLYVKAGPFASVALKATSKLLVDTLYSRLEDLPVGHYDSTKDTTEVGLGFNQSFVNSLRQFDVGAGFAVGYQTAIARGVDVFINLSYNIGFFSVEEQPKYKNCPLRNQYFSASAGFFFVNARKGRNIYRRRH